MEKRGGKVVPLHPILTEIDAGRVISVIVDAAPTAEAGGKSGVAEEAANGDDATRKLIVGEVKENPAPYLLRQKTRGVHRGYRTSVFFLHGRDEDRDEWRIFSAKEILLHPGLSGHFSLWASYGPSLSLH